MSHGRLRATDELRPIKATYNLVDTQDSSSTISFGPLRILTSLSGPTAIQIRKELTDRCHLEVSITPQTGVSNLSYSTFSQSLVSIFENTLILSHFPRSHLAVDCQVLSLPKAKQSGFKVRNSRNGIQDREQEPDPDQDQDPDKGKRYKQSNSQSKSSIRIDKGDSQRSTNRNHLSNHSTTPTPSEKSTMINSIQLTLLISGPVVGARSTVASVACAVVRKSEIDDERSGRGWRGAESGLPEEEDDSPIILIDPTPTEENLALSTHVFAFSFSGRRIGSGHDDDADADDDDDDDDGSRERKRRRLREAQAQLEVEGMKLDRDLQTTDGQVGGDGKNHGGEGDVAGAGAGSGERVELVYCESLGRVEIDLFEEITAKALEKSREVYRFMRAEMARLERV